MPDLDFHVESVKAVKYAVSPTLHFKLGIEDREDESIHTVVLNCQIRLDPARRKYSSIEEERLLDLFGPPSRWGQTLKAMLWTHASVIVPPFTKKASVNLPVACSYDFNIAASKFFNALEDGEVPLLLLFSGSIFYDAGEGQLQVTQISWEKEAHFSLPVRVWKEMMDIYYPNTAWLCLRKDVFDQLYRFKSQNSIPTWERAMEKLLEQSDGVAK